MSLALLSVVSFSRTSQCGYFPNYYVLNLKLTNWFLHFLLLSSSVVVLVVVDIVVDVVVVVVDVVAAAVALLVVVVAVA